MAFGRVLWQKFMLLLTAFVGLSPLLWLASTPHHFFDVVEEVLLDEFE
jgi:hypothetical protein